MVIESDRCRPDERMSATLYWDSKAAVPLPDGTGRCADGVERPLWVGTNTRGTSGLGSLYAQGGRSATLGNVSEADMEPMQAADRDGWKADCRLSGALLEIRTLSSRWSWPNQRVHCFNPKHQATLRCAPPRGRQPAAPGRPERSSADCR